MSFWSSLGKAAGAVGKAAYEGVQNKMERIQDYKDRYEEYDDERLFKMLKSTSDQDKKTAIKMLLKERGYGNQGE